MDSQLSSPTKKTTDTTATDVTHNNYDNGCDEPVVKQPVVMRRTANEPHEQKERPLSISQRIKQLQLNAEENVRKHNLVVKRQNRPFTAIGNVK